LVEQYFTSSQTFSHFFRKVNGLPQLWQIFAGRSDLLMPLGIAAAIIHNSKAPYLTPELEKTSE